MTLQLWVSLMEKILSTELRTGRPLCGMRWCPLMFEWEADNVQSTAGGRNIRASDFKLKQWTNWYSRVALLWGLDPRFDCTNEHTSHTQPWESSLQHSNSTIVSSIRVVLRFVSTQPTLNWKIYNDRGNWNYKKLPHFFLHNGSA